MSDDRAVFSMDHLKSKMTAIAEEYSGYEDKITSTSKDIGQQVEDLGLSLQSFTELCAILHTTFVGIDNCLTQGEIPVKIALQNALLINHELLSDWQREHRVTGSLFREAVSLGLFASVFAVEVVKDVADSAPDVQTV